MESKFKRVVLKIAGDIFSAKDDWFDPSALNFLVEEIMTVYELFEDLQMIIIPGGNNVAKPEELVNCGIDRTVADQIGMLGTLFNSLILMDLLEQRGFDVRLQIAIEMRDISEPFIRRRAIRHNEKDRIVILACGLGSPSFTTDTAAVVRAMELNADIVLKGTVVDGIYDLDPRLHREAKLLPTLTYDRALMLMLGGPVFDSTTIVQARDVRMPIILFQMGGGNLVKVIQGEAIGSLIADRETIAKLRPEYAQLWEAAHQRRYRSWREAIRDSLHYFVKGRQESAAGQENPKGGQQ